MLLTIAWPTTTGAYAAPAATDRLLAPPAACPGAADASAAEQLATMRCLVGYARAHAGAPKLQASTTLAQAGMLKLNADIRCGAFTHTPCGQPFDRVFTAAGFPTDGSYSAGENLAYGQDLRGSPWQVMQVWLASPEHRQVLLSADWTTFGLAVRQNTTFLGDSHVVLWANEFAGP
jgi:uncharacterized protein YkwD